MYFHGGISKPILTFCWGSAFCRLWELLASQQGTIHTSLTCWSMLQPSCGLTIGCRNSSLCPLAARRTWTIRYLYCISSLARTVDGCRSVAWKSFPLVRCTVGGHYRWSRLLCTLYFRSDIHLSTDTGSSLDSYTSFCHLRCPSLLSFFGGLWCCGSWWLYRCWAYSYNLSWWCSSWIFCSVWSLWGSVYWRDVRTVDRCWTWHFC